MEREPNTQYVASISYGKDSLAMLEAIKILGYPLDRIITSEVWFDDEIQADLPPMVAFKDTADKIILDRYGIKVEHFCAMNKDGTKKTYKQLFYHIPKRRKASADTESPFEGMVKGFPQTRIGGTIWCKHLKETKIEPIGDSLMASPKMGGAVGATNSKKVGIEFNQRLPEKRLTVVQLRPQIWDFGQDQAFFPICPVKSGARQVRFHISG